VRIGKHKETEKQTVSETVRHEDVEIEKEGDSRLDPATGRPRTERYQPKERGRS
jgi:stress response protein YsnF